MDHDAIYRQQPAAYDQLVSYEDADGHLARALNNLVPASGACVLDVGTGTGRVARLLAGTAGRIVGLDRSLAMLEVAAGLGAGTGRSRMLWAAADHNHLPVKNGWADLVIAGWSLGHSVAWSGPEWPTVIGRAVQEMARTVRQGGKLAIIETLGTGTDRPNAPTPGLADYYAWLEGEHGFSREWFRTDYLFDTPQQAQDLIGFFFGADMARSVASTGDRRVPECTGLWSRLAA